MRRSKTELMDIVKKIIGDRTDDEYISYIEDFNDSIDDESIDWRNKYDELDKSWRERYTSRFFESTNDTETYDDSRNSSFDERSDITIDNIFKENK